MFLVYSEVITGEIEHLPIGIDFRYVSSAVHKDLVSSFPILVT